MSKKKSVTSSLPAAVKTSSVKARQHEPARSTPVASALPLGFESFPGLIAFGFFGLLLAVMPYFFSGFWPSSYEYWPQALFLALAACAFVLLALEPKPQIPNSKSQVALCLALFGAWCAISIGGTVYLHDSFLELARVGGVLACFFLAHAFFASPESFTTRATWLIAAAVAGGVLVCVPAILDFFATRNPRQFATFYNPNLFANYCAMALPLAAGGVLLLRQSARENHSSPTPVVVAGIAVIAIIALGLIVTSSKGGFLAALCGLLVFAVAVLRAKGERAKTALRERKAVVTIIAILVLIVGGVLFSQTILPRLSSNLENDHSTMFRLYTWGGTFDMAAARPLTGWGIGSFPSAYPQFAQTGYTRSAHQSWLQIAAECGFPAMLFLLAACGFAFVRGWKMLAGIRWPIAAGALGALAAFAIHGLTDSGWGIVSIGVLLAGVLALLENREPTLEERRQSANHRQSALNWPLLLAALPLAFGSWISQNAQGGEDLRTESRESMSRGLRSNALEQAVAATEADPLSARLLANLAQTQEATGQDAAPSYESMLRLQPTRALNYLDYAEFLIEKKGDEKRIAQLLDEAVRLDANDPQIRLSRARWFLDKDKSKARNDLIYIAALALKPYGKYPATPEMVDLNFARAYVLLAQNFEQEKFDEASLTERGLSDIATARKYEKQRREMEIAVRGVADEARTRELDELEMELKSLQEKLK